MIDHLVFAGAALSQASAEIAERLGVTPAPGGSHVGLGTRNELLSLGGSTYLEVIGPDLDQPPPTQPRPFRVDDHVRPALAAWCARPARPLDDIVAATRAEGIELGDVASMSRRRPDGVLLEWRLTLPQLDGPFGCALPFLIDWGESPHPTATLAPAVQLIELEVVHADPQRLRAALDIIGITSDCTLRRGPEPVLRARLATDHGEVTLTS